MKKSGKPGHAIEKSYSSDVAIIGAGAAGISIARELANTRLRVMLIESGNETITRSAQSLNQAEQSGLRTFSSVTSRFRCFGGSTVHWGGQCRPLDVTDFNEQSGQEDGGWPFTYSELAPYYQRAAEVCHLPAAFDTTAWRLPPASSVIDKITYQFAYPRHLGESYRAEIEGAANIHVLLSTTVTLINLNQQGNRVASLSAITQDGQQTSIVADTVVLASGGIENARLLLASSNVRTKGVGNENDLVGRYYSDHPYAFIGELTTDDAAVRDLTIDTYDRVGSHQKSHLALTLSDERIRSEGLNKCALYLVRRPTYKCTAEYYSRAGVSMNYMVDLLRARETLVRPLMPELQSVAQGIRSILTTAGHAASHIVNPTHKLAVRVVMATRPHASSRVTLSNRVDRLGVPVPRIDWQIHGDDREGLMALMESAKAFFSNQNIGELREFHWDDTTGWPHGMTGGKHHMGTTRMHVHPESGVVNADCRVHGVDNLFIAGSSVFPSGGYANPTLTIVALAIRLADHLRQE